MAGPAESDTESVTAPPYSPISITEESLNLTFNDTLHSEEDLLIVSEAELSMEAEEHLVILTVHIHINTCMLTTCRILNVFSRREIVHGLATSL